MTLIAAEHVCVPQVNLLVLHEAFSPSTPRLIREAAALLSPQSVAMPVQQAEHVTPITGSSGEDQAKALFASILQLANTGVLLWGAFLLLCADTLRGVQGMHACFLLPSILVKGSLQRLLLAAALLIWISRLPQEQGAAAAGHAAAKTINSARQGLVLPALPYACLSGILLLGASRRHCSG